MTAGYRHPEALEGFLRRSRSGARRTGSTQLSASTAGYENATQRAAHSPHYSEEMLWRLRVSHPHWEQWFREWIYETP